MRFLLLACLLGVAPGLNAHEVRPALLDISEVDPGHFLVTWKQPVVGTRRLPLEPTLPDACRAVSPVDTQRLDGAAVSVWSVECDLHSGRISVDGLSRTITDVMVQLTRLDGSQAQWLLRPDSPALQIDAPAAPVPAYLQLGVEHLLLGFDHLLFVAGLVLLIRGKWELLKTVTAFTVAHSVTLALSVLEPVRLPQRAVEAAIAWSILFLARELYLEPQRRSALTRGRPWLMAFAFGLLHGFGFAGALAEIGLPREQLALALMLFNAGIEIGQLLLVALLLTLFWLVAQVRPGGRGGAVSPAFERAFTFGMGCLAAFWTIERIAPV